MRYMCTEGSVTQIKSSISMFLRWKEFPSTAVDHRVHAVPPEFTLEEFMCFIDPMMSHARQIVVEADGFAV